MTRHSPPRIAQWLLEGFVAARDREELLGDLAEEFSLRTHSCGTSWHWYWGQVLRSIPAIVWNSARQGRWIRTLPVALGAYILAGAVEFFVSEALSGLLPLDAPMHTAVNLLVGLAAILAGGYLAAKVRPGADLTMGVIVALAVLALMMAQAGSVPLWYQLAFLLLGPCSSVAGGAISTSRKK
jgi:hypothetical protein